MELEGTLKIKFEPIRRKDNFFTREFILTTNEGYPQDIIFSLKQSNCNLLDAFKLNDKIKVHFTHVGGVYTLPSKEIKYYNILNCYKIESLK
ncbi:MAG TPA: DUF3127 domain-containing protein [Bacteroidia bacterium]|nr:DUF3127 domain-containing protein [Bacteroidia bacterium]